MEEQSQNPTASSSSSSKISSKSDEKGSDPVSSSTKIVEDDAILKSPDADDQMKVDGSEENIEKMEVETSVLFTPSEVKQQPRVDQHLNFIASTKIEHRRADAPEYFPGCDIPVYHKVNFTVCLSFAMFSSR